MDTCAGTQATASSLAAAIKAEARRLGFARVGIVPAGPSRTHAYYEAWLGRGYAGEMGYLHRHAAPKRDPSRWAGGMRSMICVAAAYDAGEATPEGPGGGGSWAAIPRGRISRYASGRDYHDVLGERLDRLKAFIEGQTGRAVRSLAAVDASPLMEREWAARAGLGWVGRNALLIDWELGSYLFLAELLVDLDLEYDVPSPPGAKASQAAIRPELSPARRKPSARGASEGGPEAMAMPRIDLGLRESCGSCRACIDACPTTAIVADKTIDARRCLSYLTIELKGPIPSQFREALGSWVFGCDICQEVCPWNRRAPAAARPFMAAPEADAARPSLTDLLALDEAGFRARFRNTPVWRSRRRGLLRNAAIALGNVLAGTAPGESPAAVARRSALDALTRALGDPEPVIRGAAAWALGRTGDSAAREHLEQALATERDPLVRREISEAWTRPRLPTGHTHS